MRHHVQKPTVEQLAPIRIVAGNKSGKRTDAVFAVPAAYTAQVFFHRIVQRHAVRGQVAVHIPVPHTQSLLQGIHSHAIARSLVHYMEIEVDGVALAIFQITHQLVVPEFVTAFHELVQFQHRVLFGSQHGFPAESPTLAVEIVQCGAHRLFVCLPSVVHHYLPDGFLFGDAAFEALLAYGDEQRVKIIPVALPVFHLVQCTPQGCLKQQGESLRGVESRLQPL